MNRFGFEFPGLGHDLAPWLVEIDARSVWMVAPARTPKLLRPTLSRQKIQLGTFDQSFAKIAVIRGQARHQVAGFLHRLNDAFCCFTGACLCRDLHKDPLPTFIRKTWFDTMTATNSHKYLFDCSRNNDGGDSRIRRLN